MVNSAFNPDPGKILEVATVQFRFMFEFEEKPQLSVRDLVTLLRGNLYKATIYLHIRYIKDSRSN